MKTLSKTALRGSAVALILILGALAPCTADAKSADENRPAGENDLPRYCLSEEQIDALNELLCAPSEAPAWSAETGLESMPEAAGEGRSKFWRRLAQAEELIRVLRHLAEIFGLGPDAAPMDPTPVKPPIVTPPPVTPPPVTPPPVTPPPVTPPPVTPPPVTPPPIDFTPGEDPLDPAAAWGISLLGSEGFRPTPGAPSLRLPLDVPPGRYRRATFHLEVSRSAWGRPSDALQNLIWLVKRNRRDKPLNRYMLFYVNVRGPARDQLMLRHGWGTRQGKKAKVERAFHMAAEAFYTLDGDFDLATGETVLRVGGPAEMEIRSAMANKEGVESLELGPDEGLWLELGFDGRHAGEVPLEGWYRNLRVELYE